MTLDDPLLKWAYASVFLESMGPLEQLRPTLKLALADMRRRGEAVSPMLLRLISENQENRIEFSILGKIALLGYGPYPAVSGIRPQAAARTHEDHDCWCRCGGVVHTGEPWSRRKMKRCSNG